MTQAVRNEPARGVDGVLSRRTCALFLNLAATSESATAVSRQIARELALNSPATSDLAVFQGLLAELRSAVELDLPRT